MSYSLQKYIPIEQTSPGWQQSPVPTWGGNPHHAGPRRVGVGCAPTGCCGTGGCGVGADEPYKEVGWGMVAAAAAGSLLVGLLIGHAAGKRRLTANRRRARSRVWRKNRARGESHDASSSVCPERTSWPINDREHAIKALQYATKHKARRPEVLSAVAAEWGGDPQVREKFQQYFPRSADTYLKAT